MRILQIVGASFLLTSPAFAQVRVEIVAPPPPRVQIVAPPPPRIVVPAPPRMVVTPPAVRFVAAPPLVEVEPGVQVVEDNDEEVFYVDGYYWHPSPDGAWFRTRSWRGGWVVAAPPARLQRLPRGEYRHYRREAREERHEERRMERDERKGERRAEKSERKWEKHHGR